jgi:hypothetical protein
MKISQTLSRLRQSCFVRAIFYPFIHSTHKETIRDTEQTPQLSSVAQNSRPTSGASSTAIVGGSPKPVK